jgi:hypothetical protein
MSTTNDTVEALKERVRKLDADYAIDRNSLIRSIRLIDPSVSVVPSRPIPSVEDSIAAQSFKLPPRRIKSVNTKAYGSIGKAVKAIVLSMDGEFTKGDVDQKLKEQYPEIAHRVDGSLANYLWLYSSRDKIIRVTQKSNGREQAKYMKI